MSTTIDERVVEMRFDNKQFEQETKRTMGTLAKLKEALKIPGAEKALVGVDKAAKNIHLEGIASGVDLLTKRFSTFGIASMQIIQNVTNALQNKLAAAVNFVSDAIVSGGIKRAMNIENAHFQLQALLKDEAKVQAVMDNAMESVDGTAYAYDEAAKAASMFAASGLEAGEEMLQALKGITGVAAMTNSDFQSMSMIFTTVAGNGRLMGDQLLQLSSRGLNAASTIADYFREVRGEADITESTIREMVSDGEISFKIFSDAMSWAFGDSAKRANETFTGAMSNMKSALARIGAGFISPLIEQNGEMVNLFNTLRIKINEVKSALVFDEQTSAISGMAEKADIMVQTVADLTKEGKINFDMFTSAILGASRSEEELAELNEKLAITFGDISQAGYASNEALNSIKRNGIDSYDALAKYLNGVTNGTIKATTEMKYSVNELTRGTQITKDSIVDFANEGKITFDMFNNAIVNYSGLVKKEGKATSEAIKIMLTSVKESGGVTNDILNQFRDSGINATNALRNYINGVTKGTIRATYSTKKEIEDLTGGLEVTISDIRKFADEGKISFNTFQSAMEKSFGNSKKLSKQFTDYALDTLSRLVKYIDSIDIETPMKIFYSGVESLKNIFKGLGDVAEPAIKSFKNVFLIFDTNRLVDFAANIENITSKLTLSEKASINLEKAFTGVFEVIKALVGVVGRFVNALKPSKETMDQVSDGFFDVAGSSGEALSRFAEWLNTSEKVNTVINDLAEGVKSVAELFVRLADTIKTNILSGDIGNFQSVFDDFINWINEKIAPAFKDVTGGNVIAVGSAIGMILTVMEIAKSLKGFNFKLPNIFGDVSGVLTSMKNALVAFTTDVRTDLLAKVIGSIAALGITLTIMSHADWDNMEKAALMLVIVSGLIAFGVVKLSNSVGRIQNVSDLFEMLAKHLKKSINAFILSVNLKTITETMKGLATAIGVITGSLGGIFYMASTDPDALNHALIVLGGITFALIGIVAGIMALSSKMKGGVGNPKSLISSFVSILDVVGALGGALYIINKTFEMEVPDDWVTKIVAVGVTLVAMIGLVKILNKLKIDSGAIKAAFGLVGLCAALSAVVSAMEKMFSIEIPSDWPSKALAVGLTIGAMIGVLKILDMVKTGGNSLKSAFGLISLCVVLSAVVSSMEKLFSLEIPSDWPLKVLALGITIGAMVGLLKILDMIKIDNGATKVAFGLVGISLVLMLVVNSLEKLFSLEIPSDWPSKALAVGLTIGAMIGLLAILGKVNKVGTGGMKSAVQMLALSAVLVAVGFSLEKLASIPGNKMLKAVVALDGVLLGLAVVFSHMGQVGGKGDTGKSVLYMAAVIAAIAGSLTILGLIPMEDLRNAVIALDAVLLMIALDFAAVGKVTNKESTNSILYMAIMTGAIALSLMALADKPWEGLLAGATALSEVLLAMAAAFRIIGNANAEFNKDTLYTFLTLIGISVVITTELMFLSDKPWEGLLAGATALSMVLLAMAGAFRIISDATVVYDKETFAMFASLVATTVVITAELMFLSNQPWEGLLAGATALSEVLLAMAAAFRIIADCNVEYDEGTFAMFASLIIASGVITAELMFLSNQPWEGLLAGATALSEVLLAMAGVMAILTKCKTNVKTASDAALAFDAFVAIIAGILVAFAGIDELVKAASGGKYSLEGLIDQGSGILSKIGFALGDFVGNIIGGVGSGITSALPKMGEDLGMFMENSKDFWPALSAVDKNATEAVKNLAEVLLIVTAADILDGMFAFFTKGMSLAKFGLELKAFGTPLKEFAEEVKDVDAKQVEGAASAAKIMAEMAKTLPKISGLGVLIFGVNKNLSDFGEELKVFGPSIAEFAEKVKGITPEQVEGAAAAGKIMAALYDELPTIGGLSGLIFGESKKISDFGRELKLFGPNLVDFADKVKGIDESAVTGAYSAASIMATLANEMPSIEPLWKKLFGGTKVTLTKFSSDLIIFGENMVSFTESLTDFDDTNVKSAVDSFKKLVDLAKYIEEEDTDASPITAFANSLKSMAINAIDGFVEGFKESDDKAKTAVDGLIAVATQAVYDSAENMKKNSSLLGQVMAIAVAEGIGEKESLVTEKINELALGMLVTLETATVSSLFDQITQNALSGIVTAVTVKRPVIATAIRELGHTMTQTLKTALPQSTFNTIGQNAFQGLYNGIKARKDLIVTATRTIGQEIVNTAKTGLQASKFEPFGRNIPSGIISGLGARKNLALTAVNSLCVELINKMKTSLPNSTFVTMGSNIAANLIAGINSQQEPVRAAAQNLVDIASKTMEGVAVSINEQMNAVSTSTEQTLTELNRTLQKPGTSKAAQNVGKNAVKGVGVGITRESKTVTKATEKVAKSIPKTMQKILEIHSPSRVMIELGEYITQGVAEGIGNKEIDIRDAVDNIVNAIMEGFDKIINSEIGEKISLAIAEGISNKQFEIEDAMDRIVNLVTEKMEKLKETINETMASIEDEYFGIEPDITPVVDTDKLEDIKDMVPTVGEPPVANNSQTSGTMNEPPVMNKTEFKQVLGEAIPPLIKEFVGAPIQAPNSPKYEGSPIAAPDLSAPLAPIQQDFSDAVKVSANNAKGVQEQVKYSQTQNSLENAAITKQLEDLNETLKHEGEPMPPMQNTFYITGDNPQEIAQEVSKILQQQVEREETKWA